MEEIGRMMRDDDTAAVDADEVAFRIVEYKRTVEKVRES